MLDSLFRTFDNIIVLDVETTGFDPRRDEIIEIAALRLDKGRTIQSPDRELDVLIKLSADRRLPQAIIELTGINEVQLSINGIEKSRACDLIVERLGCSNPLLVAYNAQFDLSFIYFFLDRFGKAGILDNVKFLDALTVYKDRKPYPHTLKNAVCAYAIKTQNTHRAIDDTKATFELLCAMDQELSDLQQYINLFGYNPKYGVTGQKFKSVRYLPQPYNISKKLYEC